jgi:hypothetical protein
LGAPINGLRWSPDDSQPQRGEIKQPGAAPRVIALPASEAPIGKLRRKCLILNASRV